MAASIAISGASGYLGSRLCRLFVEKGHDVVGFKRRGSDLVRLAGLESRMRLHDVDGKGDPLAGIPAPQVVIHAATQYGRPNETSVDVYEANLHFPMRLLESAAGMGVESFVNVDTVLPPSANDYGRSKRAFRDQGRSRSATGGPAFVNVLSGNLYGPWDHPAKFPSHVIRSCARNVPELPLTAGEQERDFLYIDDALAAFAVIVDCLLEGPATMEFELGKGEGTSVRHFAETAQRLSASRTRLAFGALPYSGGDPMKLVTNPAALRSLGWEPRVDLEEGIRSILEAEASR